MAASCTRCTPTRLRPFEHLCSLQLQTHISNYECANSVRNLANSRDAARRRVSRLHASHGVANVDTLASACAHAVARRTRGRSDAVAAGGCAPPRHLPVDVACAPAQWVS